MNILKEGQKDHISEEISSLKAEGEQKKSSMVAFLSLFYIVINQAGSSKRDCYIDSPIYFKAADANLEVTELLQGV